MGIQWHLSLLIPHPQIIFTFQRPRQAKKKGIVMMRSPLMKSVAIFLVGMVLVQHAFAAVTAAVDYLQVREGGKKEEGEEGVLS